MIKGRLITNSRSPRRYEISPHCEYEKSVSIEELRVPAFQRPIVTVPSLCNRAFDICLACDSEFLVNIVYCPNDNSYPFCAQRVDFASVHETSKVISSPLL